MEDTVTTSGWPQMLLLHTFPGVPDDANNWSGSCFIKNPHTCLATVQKESLYANGTASPVFKITLCCLSLLKTKTFKQHSVLLTLLFWGSSISWDREGALPSQRALVNQWVTISVKPEFPARSHICSSHHASLQPLIVIRRVHKPTVVSGTLWSNTMANLHR